MVNTKFPSLVLLRYAGVNLAACLALSADTLTLRNGVTVEGNYLGGTAREVRMDLGDKVHSYPVDTVAAIHFGPSNPEISAGPAPNRPDQQSSSLNYPVNPSSSNPRLEERPASRMNSAEADLPAGTQLTVRMLDAVDSERSRTGDTFRATLDESVMVNGQTAIPRGAEVIARLVEDQKSGKIQGRTTLKLILTSVNVNGRMIDISTQDLSKESGSRGARSAAVIGGTTALGAILGGVAGGGRGAAIGAGSGAAVGTGAQEVTGPQRVKIPSETRLVFTLSYSVRL